MKHQITKIMYTETAHRLMGHPGLCQHLHGHSYRWEVTVRADKLDEGDMVMDFARLKNILFDTVGRYDHATVLEEADPLRKALIAACEERRLITMPTRPTAEVMCAEVAFELCDLLKMDVTVKLWETTSSFAEFTATIKKEE